ncbi:nucleotide-binding universal stress UspA family protein/uncharacterized protein YnzC (UPF0291/DUF896 family) [Mesonia hippocampi]|uniref:Nucleotide-binding universal stress UspA family protein/uncharacterized protein YnzC (UPF0291/DUF896 family) n=1 Tax=Mesonia hippocampi TaxID=1628250 RepID=A0A840EU64_9FLAO|nr:universal stress protein [Mesonia hippocampi]MBB4120053.1 nucleotide-binding universal stress UspA family protein/uncharacterized protein YnzC (UPF0291/DUF896 family) [Mesonia hippocampi]
MLSVLILTDFSNNAWAALNYAIGVFSSTQANYHLLHINEHEEISSAIKITKETKLLQEKLKRNFPEIVNQISILTDTGNFIETVRKHIKINQIDFICMGTKGLHQQQNATLGSHAAAVITRVKCPVFVIPEKAQVKLPQQVLFPTDFNSLYQYKALKSLLKIGKIHKTLLNVLYVFKKPSKFTELQEKHRNVLRMYLQEIKHQFIFQRNKTLEHAVQAVVEATECSLIAMPARHLNLFQHILFEPESEKINYPETIPFLVLHAN